jgi:hypothetical protein
MAEAAEVIDGDEVPGAAMSLGEALAHGIGTQKRVRREALRCLREGRPERADELLRGSDEDRAWCDRGGAEGPGQSSLRGDRPGPLPEGRRGIPRRLGLAPRRDVGRRNDPTRSDRAPRPDRAGSSLRGVGAVARKETPEVRVDLKVELARRLREIRRDRFGEHGGPELARRLHLPPRTWYNYEVGTTMPAEVLLSFLDLTGASPAWLLSGRGPKYLGVTGRGSEKRRSPGR